MPVPGESLPRRSSRSHLPSAKSVDCLSSRYHNYNGLNLTAQPFPPKQGNRSLIPTEQQAQNDGRDVTPSMLRKTSFGHNISQMSSPQLSNLNKVPSMLAPAPSLIAKKMQVAFSMRVETHFGDTAVLVGSTPQLGAWQPERGVRMSTDENTYPMWHVLLLLDCEDDPTSLEYKVVILRARGQVDWEELPNNRHLSLFAGREARVRGMWNDPHVEEEALVKHRQPEESQPAAQTVTPSAPVMGVPVPQTLSTLGAFVQMANTQAASPITHPEPNPPQSTSTAYKAFNVAPRPNHSFSITGGAPANPIAHQAFDGQRAMALLNGQLTAGGNPAAPPPAHPPSDPTAAAEMAAQPPPPQGATREAEASVRIRTGGSNVEIAAAPPSGQPVSLTLPEAVPRLGQPLSAIRSNDQVRTFWLASNSSFG